MNQTPKKVDSPQENSQIDDVNTPAINDDGNSNSSPQNLNVFAKISQFNERFDLVLSTIESHNPGFLKRATDNIEHFDENLRGIRFRFGGKQAYTALICSWVGIATCFPAFFYVIFQDIAGFWNTTLIVLMLAASQSGFSGFMRIIDGFSQLLNSFRRKE